MYVRLDKVSDVANIDEQLDEAGQAKYEGTEDTELVVIITAPCIVFVISGAFSIASGKVDILPGWGYELKDETKITLQAGTAVVIIQL